MKCLIVDDESLAAERLVRLMSEVVPNVECFVAKNAQPPFYSRRGRGGGLLLGRPGPS